MCWLDGVNVVASGDSDEIVSDFRSYDWLALQLILRNRLRHERQKGQGDKAARVKAVGNTSWVQMGWTLTRPSKHVGFDSFSASENFGKISAE